MEIGGGRGDRAGSGVGWVELGGARRAWGMWAVGSREMK